MYCIHQVATYWKKTGMLCVSVDIYRLIDVFISAAEVRYGHNCTRRTDFMNSVQ